MGSHCGGVNSTRGVIKTVGLGSGVVTTTDCSEMSFACEGVQKIFFATFLVSR